MDKILLFFCVRAVISTEVQVLRYVATQLWAFTALHPPAVGWPITLLTQPGRSENWVVPGALVNTTGQQEREPSSFSLLQANGPERKERQEKGTPREGLLLSQSRDSRVMLDYNPCYVFISALFTRCCSPWLSCLLSTARSTTTSPGKTLPPCKANP